MEHTFQTEQWIPHHIVEVFAFFADPNNLPRLMPPWQQARIEHLSLVPPPPRPSASFHPSLERDPLHIPVAAGAGTTITISFRPLPMSPVRLHWDALIRDFAWNSHFCDQQLQGPFHSWLHCHHVRVERRDGVDGTVITDRLTYALPARKLGDLANAIGGRAQIRSIFRYRQQSVERIFSTPRR